MNCIFCKIINRELPAKILYEDESLIAFNDIAPQAPCHILIIPKIHIATINDTNTNHQLLLGKMITVAKDLAADEGLAESGYRLVFNINQHGGQAVYHIHLHLLGGRQLAWPPG